MINQGNVDPLELQEGGQSPAEPVGSRDRGREPLPNTVLGVGALLTLLWVWLEPFATIPTKIKGLPCICSHSEQALNVPLGARHC